MRTPSLANIMDVISIDKSLSFEQKAELLSGDNRDRLKSLIGGAAGASLMNVLANYIQLGKTSQIVLSTLGFGAGMIIYDAWKRNNFSTWNDNSRAYEIDSRKH